MGLFKFIKEAGAKIFGGGAQAATPEKLKKEVEGHGFDADKLGIEVEGDKVKLSGHAIEPGGGREDHPLARQHLRRRRGRHQSASRSQQPAAESTMYTVQKGDTLWDIAEKHYGKGKGAKYTEIVKANSPPVKDPT